MFDHKSQPEVTQICIKIFGWITCPLACDVFNLLWSENDSTDALSEWSSWLGVLTSGHLGGCDAGTDGVGDVSCQKVFLVVKGIDGLIFCVPLATHLRTVFLKNFIFNVVQWKLSIPQKTKIDVHQFGIIDIREFEPQFEKFELEIYLQMMIKWINTAVDAITLNTIALGWIVVSTNSKT